MTRRLLIWALAAATLAAFVATMIISPFARSVGYWPWLLAPVIAAPMSSLILTYVPGNLVGRLMLAFPVLMIGSIFGWSVVEVTGTVEQAAWAEASFGMGGLVGALFLPLAVLRFPDGKPNTPRWRIVEGIAIAAMVIGSVATLLNGGWGGDITAAERPSPLRAVTYPVGDILSTVFTPLLLAALTGAAASVFVRFHRSDGEARQQVKFLMVAAALASGGALVAGGTFNQAWENVVGGIGFTLIPVAIGLAVLRFRLYDIDLVINRTVLFLLLAAFITALYSGIVVGLTALGTQGELGPSIAATAVIALAFEPFRLRAQRWADKVAFGKRATPYEVLSDLTQRLASTESTRGLFDRTAQRLADGTGAERAGVWVAADDGFLLAGQWPQDSWTAAVSQLQDLPGTVVEIEAGGEQLGALTVEKRRGDSITPTETRLIQDLAGSSAPLLQNLGLQAELEAGAKELAASRRRLVDVQGLERRRLERALDEGAQQLVVSLKVKLNVAARLARVESAEQLAVMLEGMDQDARGAITQIRSLARGLYPQLLEAEGLAAAVRSIADFGSVPVEVEEGGIGRFPAELEATAFFCISEAITNAAKHAPGRVVKVKLEMSDQQLLFSVRDEGPGFDRHTVELGSGLRNMADRLDASGGHLQITSSPGHGTTITGTIPTHDLVPA
jgi:signal transduction histidine kinase